jgi:Prohead core protein serine protease
MRNLLVEYRMLEGVKVIRESSNGIKKLKLKGKFQKCDEQNNNGRIYPRKVLESQVKSLQGKIDERSLVGALDHPTNDTIQLSQASHLITKLEVLPNGDVIGEAEILSTPSGKIVEALINDGVKIGVSSRGLGTVSESKTGKIVNEDFQLITFDLVSDPSTKGAFPELSESLKENSLKAQKIVTKVKREQVLMTLLTNKINEAIRPSKKSSNDDSFDKSRDNKLARSGGYLHKAPKPSSDSKPESKPAETPKTTNPVPTSAQVSNHKSKYNKPFNQKLIRKLSVAKGDTDTKPSLVAKRKVKTSEVYSRIEALLKPASVELPEAKTLADCILSLNEATSDSTIKAIKNYLINHLNDIFYSRPYEPASIGSKPVDVDKEKLEFFEKLIAAIKDLD